MKTLVPKALGAVASVAGFSPEFLPPASRLLPGAWRIFYCDEPKDYEISAQEGFEYIRRSNAPSLQFLLSQG